MNEKVFELALYMIPVILSITVHEYAHALASFKLGDDTAKSMGRLTLNPIAHIDIFGTLLIPIIGILSGFPFFGWAKPVPFNPVRFNRRFRMKTSIMITAVAGPLANIILAVLMIIIGRLVIFGHQSGIPGMEKVTNPAGLLVIMTMNVNVSLALFNLLPVPPLDGSKILYGILPDSALPVMDFIERYSFVLFILVLMFGGRVILPPLQAVLGFFYKLMLG